MSNYEFLSNNKKINVCDLVTHFKIPRTNGYFLTFLYTEVITR